MSKIVLEEITQLVEKLVIPFYQIERDMALPISFRRNENDAEHSWSVALIACSLVKEIDPTLNTGKVSQLALVHDLVELYAGDTSVWDQEDLLSTKEEREAEALQKITQQYRHFPWITETVLEYEQKTSNESTYVRAIDKLIALLIRLIDQGQFFKDNQITQERFEQSLVSHRQKAQGHPGVAKYYEELRAIFVEHPEYFYKAQEEL